MAKQIIRLTEGDIHNMIRSAVNRLLRESDEDNAWKDAYDKFNRGEIDSMDEYMRLARERFGGDEMARIKALNRHIEDKDARRAMRMSPEELAREKAWEKQYDIENGINHSSEDADLFDFEKERAEQLKKLTKKRMKQNARKPGSRRPADTPQEPTKFSGLSPEELEAKFKELGYGV